jgi:hypothetical protein
MSSKVMRQILQTIEDGVNSRPSAIEFEMAYQARVAIDRIRFAIKHTETRDAAAGENPQCAIVWPYRSTTVLRTLRICGVSLKTR